MAEQLRAPPRAVYRDLQVLEELHVPLFTDKSGRESLWKIDPDYRNSSRSLLPFQNFSLFILRKMLFVPCTEPSLMTRCYLTSDIKRYWKDKAP